MNNTLVGCTLLTILTACTLAIALGSDESMMVRRVRCFSWLALGVFFEWATVSAAHETSVARWSNACLFEVIAVTFLGAALDSHVKMREQKIRNELTRSSLARLRAGSNPMKSIDPLQKEHVYAE